MSELEPPTGDRGDEPSKERNRGLRRRAKRIIGSQINRIKRLGRKQPREENVGDRSSLSCFRCFSVPSSSVSPRKHPYEDPTGELVRSLIESNDFYAKECNVHRRY